jgi:biopolymer transport protein ExbD
MARRRKKNELRAGELNLTAMIDVAFQLLNFFVIAVHPVDVLTNLNVFRPSPNAGGAPPAQEMKMLKIQIYRDTLTINDKSVDMRTLEGLVAKLAEYGKNQTVVIMCSPQSQHKQLVEVLDMCTKVGLSNLSVISSG